MSANNYLTVNRRTFVVRDAAYGSRTGSEVGKGKTLEEAVEIAQAYQEEYEVEYGIHIVGTRKGASEKG